MLRLHIPVSMVQTDQSTVEAKGTATWRYACLVVELAIGQFLLAYVLRAANSCVGCVQLVVKPLSATSSLTCRPFVSFALQELVLQSCISLF